MFHLRLLFCLFVCLLTSDGFSQIPGMLDGRESVFTAHRFLTDQTGTAQSGRAQDEAASVERSIVGDASVGNSQMMERGRIAFEESCTDCHEASRSLEKSKTYAQWMDTIRKMAGKQEANVRTADFESIARYLTATAKSGGVNASATDKDQSTKDKQNGPDTAAIAAGRAAFNASCLKCHDAERSTSKQKSQSEWMNTIRRMASKDGANIPASSFSAIASYLASLNGDASTGGDDEGESDKGAGGWSFGTTISTLHRSASDESSTENPGFFADVWLTTSFQGSGPWSATVTACTSCHSTNSAISSYSLELLEGSATVDIRKLFTDCEDDCAPQLSLKAGRFPVPFGAFSAMSHPGVYRTVTVPLMFNMGRRVFASGAAPPRQPVLPLPFSDEGIDFIFRQKLTSDITLGVDVYAVNGLQGNETSLFELSRAYSDNNEEPSFGLRTMLGGEFLTVGASLLNGNLQDQRQPQIDYTLWGADATAQLTERWRVYGEYARRRQDSTFVPDGAERTYGVIAESEFQILKKRYLSMVFRYDTLEHQSASFGDAAIERLTTGFNIGMPRGSLLMINHEHWQPEVGRDVDLVGVRWTISL